jgi:hypothetical protein
MKNFNDDPVNMTVKFIQRYTTVKPKKVEECLIAKLEISYPIFNSENSCKVVDKLTEAIDELTQHDCECDVEVNYKIDRSFL